MVGADDVEAGAAVAFGGGLVLDDVFPDFDVVFVDVGHRGDFLIGRVFDWRGAAENGGDFFDWDGVI